MFFFFAFLFAYFYLRSLNSQGLWRPKHVDPSTTLGTLIAASVVVAALLLRLALANHRADNLPRVAAEGRRRARPARSPRSSLQIAEWATQGFGPTDGGYASVYVGWTGLEVLFVLGLAVLARDDARHLAALSQVRERAQFEPGEAAGRSGSRGARHRRSALPRARRARRALLLRGRARRRSASPPGSSSTFSRDGLPAAERELAGQWPLYVLVAAAFLYCARRPAHASSSESPAQRRVLRRARDARARRGLAGRRLLRPSVLGRT